MRDANDVAHVGQYDLQELVHVYAARIGKAKQRVVCEDGMVAHDGRMQERL